MTRLIIAGSRYYTDYSTVEKDVDFIRSRHHIDTIVSGTARGVDSLGERYAKEHNINLMRFAPDWDRYGKRAGYIRNTEMANNADILLVIMYPDSKGSMLMYNIAKQKKLTIYKRILNKDPNKSINCVQKGEDTK